MFTFTNLYSHIFFRYRSHLRHDNSFKKNLCPRVWREKIVRKRQKKKRRRILTVFKRRCGEMVGIRGWDNGVDDRGGGGKALGSMMRGAEPLFRPSVYIPSSRIIAWLQQHEWKIERGVRRSRVKNSIGRKIRDDSVLGVTLRGLRDLASLRRDVVGIFLVERWHEGAGRNSIGDTRLRGSRKQRHGRGKEKKVVFYF